MISTSVAISRARKPSLVRSCPSSGRSTRAPRVEVSCAGGSRGSFCLWSSRNEILEGLFPPPTKIDKSSHSTPDAERITEDGVGIEICSEAERSKRDVGRNSQKEGRGWRLGRFVGLFVGDHFLQRRSQRGKGNRGETWTHSPSDFLTGSFSVCCRFFQHQPSQPRTKISSWIVLAIDASVVLHLADGMAHL